MITGNCPTGTHATYVEADQGGIGAARWALLKYTRCAVSPTPCSSGVYKRWVRPQERRNAQGGRFFGDPTRVGQRLQRCPRLLPGFIASRSKTDTFKAAQDSSRTFCIKVDKQLVHVNGRQRPAGTGRPWWRTRSAVQAALFWPKAAGTPAFQIIAGARRGWLRADKVSPSGGTQIAVYLNEITDQCTSVLVTLGFGRRQTDAVRQPGAR